MGINIDLHQIPNNKGIAIILMILSAILPPFWFMFQFALPVFKAYNLITILLLSVSVGAPILILHCLLAFILFDYLNSEKHWPRLGIMGAITTFIVFYYPSLKTLNNHQVTLASAIKISFWAEMYFLIALAGVRIIVIIIASKERKREYQVETVETDLNTPAPPVDPPLPNPHPETPSDI
jgi:hypothetical protein